MALNYGKRWTREEVILAFDLYCRIPFQHTKASNEKVQSLATLLDRTPAAVARKLGNLGSFDLALQAQNISGLTHASATDKQVWNEFQEDPMALVEAADAIKNSLSKIPPEPDFLKLSQKATEKLSLRKQRLYQSFFREAVLSSYEFSCCISGITLKDCLIASHIVPWSVSEKSRVDPSNGLCLSATFDRLFDRGLICISHDLRVEFSRELKRSCEDHEHENYTVIGVHDGIAIQLPSRFAPSRDFLEWHRKNVFKG